MDPLEIQLRNCTRSSRAVIGAICTSALLFIIMAATSVVIRPPEQRTEPALTYAFVPPPPPSEAKSESPKLSTSLQESFKFDPSIASAPEPIPLEALEIRLNPSYDTYSAIAVELQKPFALQKPEIGPPFVILDQNRVDELPVWLYGPNPRLDRWPHTKDWKVHVLYVISEKGHPHNIYVLDATDPMLHRPVVDAIADWVFRPAKTDGKPVKVWVQQLIKSSDEFKSPFSI